MQNSFKLIVISVIVISSISCGSRIKNEAVSKAGLIELSDTSALVRVDYPNLHLLDSNCQIIAKDKYVLHNCLITRFYPIWNKFGCDFDGDADIDSVYCLKPINQLVDNSKCYETSSFDGSIVLFFEREGDAFKLNKRLDNLFCPRPPSILYEEISFDRNHFRVKGDFGNGNSRKVLSFIYFSWRQEEFYADSLIIEEYGSTQNVKREVYENIPMSSFDNPVCGYY